MLIKNLFPGGMIVSYVGWEPYYKIIWYKLLCCTISQHNKRSYNSFKHQQYLFMFVYVLHTIEFDIFIYTVCLTNFIFTYHVRGSRCCWLRTYKVAIPIFLFSTLLHFSCIVIMTMFKYRQHNLQLTTWNLRWCSSDFTSVIHDGSHSKLRLVNEFQGCRTTTFGMRQSSVVTWNLEPLLNHRKKEKLRI